MRCDVGLILGIRAQDSKLNAVTSMISTAAEIVAANLLTPQDTIAPEAMAAVSGLYQKKSGEQDEPYDALASHRHSRLAERLTDAAGKEWLLDSDVNLVGPDTGAAYLCMLAIDCILGFVSAVEALTDARRSEKGHVSENSPPDPLTCAALVESTWRTVLPVLSKLLAAATTGEALMLLLLKVKPPLRRLFGPVLCV